EAKAYYKQKVWKRIVVMAAGPAVNIVLAFLILVAVRASMGGLPEPNQSVGSVMPDTPAAKVLKPGDKVVAIDGYCFPGLEPTERIERFGKIVSSHECAGGEKTDGCVAQTPVTLTV